HYAYGPTIRRSKDAGANWSQLENRPGYPKDSAFKNNRIWQLTSPDPKKPKEMWAGIDEAGLFITRDNCETWTEVDSLTKHPSRPSWMAGGGGLCLHTIIHDHSNPKRIWLGVSAVGVFKTEDGGATWETANNGISSVPTGSDDPGSVYCIHKIVQHPTDANRLFMQFHGGVYESADSAKSWQKREDGLTSNFGFPMVITPRGTQMIAPLKSDEQRYFDSGKFSVMRKTADESSWKSISKGLPTDPTFAGVLRDAMCVDRAGSAYLGTTSGQVALSNDDGESWRAIGAQLPRALCVRALTLK
ncbi:MAG TPA: hypothetical protein PK402_04845, partial [Tepidisphaeraceae bacterium]|nr:hypothetical protein [Tepidisphaeraceae bacterium]